MRGRYSESSKATPGSKATSTGLCPDPGGTTPSQADGNNTESVVAVIENRAKEVNTMADVSVTQQAAILGPLAADLNPSVKLVKRASACFQQLQRHASSKHSCSQFRCAGWNGCFEYQHHEALPHAVCRVDTHLQQHKVGAVQLCLVTMNQYMFAGA